ncbi:MAG: sensor histidine kinase [Xanthobacteraceae bacterium]
MPEVDVHRRSLSPILSPIPPQEVLAAENISLRLLLARAEIDAMDLLAQAGIDAKEREASDKLQKLIIEELHHRIKNTLATVSAIVYQSLRTVPDAEHAGHAIEGRLQALGRAHDLLLQAQWSSADLGNIVRGATQPFDDADTAKFSIVGPDIQIASGAVIAIAMTLNELCTNTTKFGALSASDGRVSIAWTVDAGHLHFTWTEKNGPAAHTPTKRSFGTRLVESLGKQLKGNVRLTYEPEGFVYALDVPLTSLIPAAAA